MTHDARADDDRSARFRSRRFGRRALFASLCVLGLVGTVSIWLFAVTPGSGTLREGPVDAETVGKPANPTPPSGMVFVLGAEFVIGSDAGDEYEYPPHTVVVEPYFIDVHEVTCEAYQRFIDATGYPAPPGWENRMFPPGQARRPVTNVTWDDATAYAAWAGKRLPTEAEWELAARGTDGRRYPWGSQWRPGLANAGPLAGKGVIDVGQLPAGESQYGALDMVGNAWEWTASDFTAYPGGVLPPQRYDYGELKVIRGGCWASTEAQATTTFRRGWPARRSNTVITYQDTGFRCAADAPVRSNAPESAPPGAHENPQRSER